MTAAPAHILVVDDNPADIELISLGFETNDFAVRVDHAADGLEAQQKIVALADAGDCPQLIVLDLNMPRANGFEVIEFIKTRQPCRHMSVVVMTTSNSLKDRDRCLELGAVAFMTKPPRFDDLLGLLRQLERYLGRPGDRPADAAQI